MLLNPIAYIYGDICIHHLDKVYVDTLVCLNPLITNNAVLFDQ